MTLPKLLKSCKISNGASRASLDNVEKQLGCQLPPDYKNVLLESDGLEGFISEDCYLSLWSSSDIASYNESYAVSEFVPGVLLVGTDGSDTGYGFRTSSGRIEYLAVPLVGMKLDAIEVMGHSFGDLIERLVG